jgi:hypothetical protein
MTCTNPQTLDTFLRYVDCQVVAITGIVEWRPLAAYGLIPVAVVLAAVYLVLRWGRR